MASKNITRADIEDAIWNLQYYARTEYGRDGELAVSEIAWYIGTGRASTEFIRALLKCRKSALVPKIAAVWSCTDDVISVTKKHLHVK